VVISEGCKTGSVASEIAMCVIEHGFDYLDAPIVRVCATDTPIPMSPTLEDEAVPNVNKIMTAIRNLVQKKI
jgi:pyruvate/2-oxoglutarate/acetoin dehydrogenase E1 component